MNHTQELRSTVARRGWMAVLLPVAAMGACGGVPQDLDGQASVQEAILTCSAPGCREFTDPTGTIKVRVRTCGWVTASGAAGSQTAVATCSVDGDAGYVLVGGGAEIENAPTPGAVLKSCIPDPASLTQTPRAHAYYTRWLARSSEYGSANSTAHRVRAYSIGLRLVGMSTTETADNLLWADSTDANAGIPFTQVVPESNVFLGGGGTVLPYNAPMYLVSSEPNGSVGWLVDAHVNGTGTDPSPPKAYAVSIDPMPRRANGQVWGQLVGTTSATIVSGSGVYVSATYTETDPHFLVTSGGGHGYSFPNEGVRRFLTDVIPGTSSQGSTVWAKSTGVSTSGGAFAAVTALSR